MATRLQAAAEAFRQASIEASLAAENLRRLREELQAAQQRNAAAAKALEEQGGALALAAIEGEEPTPTVTVELNQ